MRIAGVPDHDRVKTPPVLLKARCEVDETERVAARVAQRRRQDCRIVDVALLDGLDVEELHVEETALCIFVVDTAQERAEKRVAVHARERAPYIAAPRVDEHGDLAIADQTELETTHARLRCAWRSAR
jgi:hypothetical protein